jgi:tetratricopeptide (TPR) repeat protein
VPPAWRETPLALRQLAAASRCLEDAELQALLAAGAGDRVERLLLAVTPRLGDAAAVVLKALAVFPPEPSRQALRSVLSLAGIEPDPAALATCQPLRELDDWSLAVRPPIAACGSAAASLPGAVRRAVYRSLGTSSPDAVRALRVAAGSYFLELAPKSGSPWDLYQAWRHYFLACAYEDAYEVQKAFLEEILQRGHLDLARSILERTVASSEGRRRTVALGNLAMVYKSAGDHVRAREMYGQVAAALFEEGDTANAARALHQLGNAHFGGGNFADAISSYQESLELSAQIGERVVASATRIQLGNAFFQCGESVRALQSYKEALEEVRARKDKNIEAALELQISQIHLDRGDYLEAEACLKLAEESALACADLRSLHKIQLAQGLTARRRRDYDAARRRYDAAIETALSLGDRLEGAASLILAGELEKDRLQLAAAIGCHLRAKALLQAPGGPSAGARETSDALCHKADDCLASLQAEMGDDAFHRLAGEVETGGLART